LNAQIERFMRSIKEIIQPDAGVGTCTGIVECRERLGGLLRYYRRFDLLSNSVGRHTHARECQVLGGR
jgi:hypothetical protein